MFIINYELQDGGPLYKCTSPPKDYTENNMFFIRGTNDQGKTTTLNMVALGLHAKNIFSKDTGIISDSLRAKMDYLSSGDLDVMKFDFKIKSLDGLTEIWSQNDNGSLITKLNGEPVGPEYLNEQIQVLYDVPDDPLVKLQSSVNLIRENFIDYERYLDRYHQNLENLRTKIIDFKNKEKTIKRNRKLLEETQQNLSSKKLLKGQVKKEIEILEIANNVLFYFEIVESIEQIIEKIEILKEKRTKLKRKGIGGGTPKFKKQVEEFNSINFLVKKSISSIKKHHDVIPEENLKLIKKIETKLNRLYNPQDITPKKIEEWNNLIKEINVDLKDNPLNEQFKEEEIQSELIIKIMDVLRDYLSLNMNIPGTNLQNIFSFYSELDKFNKEIEPKIVRKRDLNEVIDELDKLLVHLSDLKVKRQNIPDVDEDQMYEYEEIVKEIAKLQKESDALGIQSLKYSDTIESLSEDEIEKILDNPGQREQYLRTKKEFESLKTDIETLKQQEKTLIARIEDLGDLKPLTLVDDGFLQKESTYCDKLRTKVKNWKMVLEQVNFRKTDSGIDYEKSKEFFDALSEFFAGILEIIYFESKSWEVEKVDLVKREYVVRNRKPIKFVQMGTGHTALNSILSRIKQNFGEKKKIILVDEIGHMDEENIGILVDEIKSQIKKGETIFALITIADSSVSEITWEPIPV